MLPGNHVSVADLQSGTVLSPGVTNFFSNRDNTTLPGRPKAFVNWVLFDEQFELVASSSGAEQVPDESTFGACPNEVVNVHTGGWKQLYQHRTIIDGRQAQIYERKEIVRFQDGEGWRLG